MPEPAPPRGLPPDEYARRLAAAQRAMAAAGLDALLLSTAAELLYFAGFRTPFWQSPTRPFFLVLPQAGRPVAVVPGIAAARMAAGGVAEVRTWPSPRPEDEGLGLLVALLGDLVPRHGAIGVPLGPETRLGLPQRDWTRLLTRLRPREVQDATALVRDLRAIKSEAEIARIGWVCRRVSEAFASVPDWLAEGLTEAEAFRRFRIACLNAGVDEVPYLVGGAGPDGPGEVIAPAGERSLAPGDVLLLDCGATRDGYHCDFDRVWALAPPSDAARRAYERLFAATEAGFAAARPGATCAELAAAMTAVLDPAGATPPDAVGRLGHGLGLQLTEPPSLRPGDDTVLSAGMVLTLEPALTLPNGAVMVHEENIAIRDDGPVCLTRRAPPELPVVPGRTGRAGAP